MDNRSLTNVSVWLRGLTEVSPPLVADVVAGGRSNLTYRLTDAAGRRFVLRRPPRAAGKNTAHDVLREHRIIAALRESSTIPVPVAIGACDDAALIGAPFYVMEHAEGVVVRDPEDVERHLAEDARQRASDELVDVLAQLHSGAPEAYGLEELGPAQDYVQRQLHRWGRIWDRSSGHSQLMDEVREHLRTSVPRQSRTRTLHGDYRLDNVILDSAGRIVAVLDWELATLGEPLADLGMLLVYWPEPDDEPIDVLHMPTTMSGFRSRSEVVARYAAITGRDVSQLPYFVALGFWKLAVIGQGVLERFQAGAYTHHDPIVDRLAASQPMLAERARAALEFA